MTKKINENLIKSEALSLSWKKRKDYKGYDKSKGSAYNSWRAIVNTKKGKIIGYPDTWKDYDVFMKEVQGVWAKGKICKRIDIKKPYSKENSFWAEKGTENLGKLVKLKYKNEEKTLIEWCEIYKLNYNGVRQRFFKGKGYAPEEILFGKQITSIKRNVIDIHKLDLQKKKDKVSKMLSSYRLKDKKKGRENNIDFNWAFEIISNSKCFYCGDTENIGFDRIDNSKGHTKDNVVPCCYICNTVRSNNFSFDEMKILGETIKEIKQCRLGKTNSLKNTD